LRQSATPTKVAG